MDAVIVYFTATFVLCLFLVIFRLLRLSALKRERQRALEEARLPTTSGVILTSWSGGGRDARVRADFQLWTVGHHRPAASLSVLNDPPPKYDELFPSKIVVEDASATDKEVKEGVLGVQHI